MSYFLGYFTKVSGISSTFMCTNYVTCQTLIHYASTKRKTCPGKYYTNLLCN